MRLATSSELRVVFFPLALLRPSRDTDTQIEQGRDFAELLEAARA